MTDLRPLGDRAWIAGFATEREARAWATAARSARIAGVTDVVLAYKSAAVHVDPSRVDFDRVESLIANLTPDPMESTDGRLWTIPVLYDGLDLAESAGSTGLSETDLVAIHSSTIYDVFAIGFQPGFPYAGYLPEPLARLPRRAEPRTRVPAGSVAIAAGQTGVYPTELPGGWNLLGRTPLRIVDLPSGHFPIRAGDRLRFAPIDVDEFIGRLGELLE